MKIGQRKQSALIYVLKSLIPYSNENLLLAYKPNKFFNELDGISVYKKSTLRNAYWRSKQQGYIKEDFDQIPKLTAEGLNKVKPFLAKKLGKKSKLIVIFDIPEATRLSRDKLRGLLLSWGFSQIQRSVWASDFDHQETLIKAINELNLSDCVEVYEGLRLIPK